MICKKNECKLYLECLNNCDQYYRVNIIKKLGPLLLEDKPIHLFCFKNSFKFKENIIQLINNHFAELSKIKYRIIPCNNDTVKVLFYNTVNVANVLNDKRKVDFLVSRGFKKEMKVIDYIEFLVKHLKKNIIPPEIGIFFGYPIKDVIGYIGHPSLKRTDIKGWEYYGNPNLSHKIYEQFDAAERSLLQCVLKKQIELEQFIKVLDLQIV